MHISTLVMAPTKQHIDKMLKNTDDIGNPIITPFEEEKEII